MKRIIIACLALILIFTDFQPPLHADTAEADNQCEDLSFTVEIIKVEDEEIKGTGTEGLEIEIEFEGSEEKVTVDSDGKYIHEIEEDLEVGDEIILSNESHEIETTVEDSDVERENIDSVLVEECEMVEEESEEEATEESDTAEEEVTEETTDEETSEEVSDEETYTDKEEESEKKDGSVEEEVTEEETFENMESEDSVEDALDEEDPEKEVKMGETIPEEEELKEISKEEASIEESTLEEKVNKEEAEEELTEEDAEGEETSSEEVADKQKEGTVEKVSDEETSEEKTNKIRKMEKGIKPKNEARIGLSSLQSKEEIFAKSQIPLKDIKDIVGITEYVSNGEQFKKAVSNENVEIIELEQSISLENDGVNAYTVSSSNGQKIINAKDHSINLGTGYLSLGGERTANGISNMVVRNASNLYTTNKESDTGFFKKSDIHFDLRLEDIHFNSADLKSGGMFGSSWEGDVHFYGKKNIINTNSGSYGMAFERIKIHENAELIMDDETDGPAFLFNRNAFDNGNYGIDIEKNAKVQVDSNSSIVETNLNKAYSPILNNNIGLNATVIFRGSGSTIFNIDTNLKFNITKPERFELTNSTSNGRLFPKLDGFLFPSGRVIEFEVNDVILKGWHNGNIGENPTSSTPRIETGVFSFERRWWLLVWEEYTKITSMSSNIPDFSKMFPPDMRSMVFEREFGIIEELDLKDDIRHTDSTISGITRSNAYITMTDEDGNEIATTKSREDGSFIFNLVHLEYSLKPNTLLGFKAHTENSRSEVIEKIVIESKLEFRDTPENINFETTEITDKETKIHRLDNKFRVEILDTTGGGDWHLTAQADRPLTNDNGDELPGALYYFSPDGSETSIEGDAVTVGTKDEAKIKEDDSTLHTIEWDENEGILLKVNPIRAAADTEYKATIDWILTDGPVK